jgi:hypothetical protein
VSNSIEPFKSGIRCYRVHSLISYFSAQFLKFVSYSFCVLFLLCTLGISREIFAGVFAVRSTPVRIRVKQACALDDVTNEL